MNVTNIIMNFDQNKNPIISYVVNVLEDLKKQIVSIQYYSLLQKLFISYIFKNLESFSDQVSSQQTLNEMVQGLNTGKNNLLQMNPILSQIMNNEKKEEQTKPVYKEQHHKEPSHDHGKINKPPVHNPPLSNTGSHQTQTNQQMNQSQMTQNMLLDQLMKANKVPPGGCAGFPGMPGVMPIGQPMPGMIPGLGMGPIPGMIPGFPGLQAMPPNLMGGMNPLFMMQGGMPSPHLLNPQMMGLLNPQAGGLSVNLMNMMKDGQLGK